MLRPRSRGLRICLIVAMGSLVSVARPSLASAQTFTACRVPDVGAIYMIGVAGTPSACLDASHVQFSWTESGQVADGAVTTEKIADGAVDGSKIADYQITNQHIVPEGIDGTAIAAGGIESSDIRNGTIGSWDLADGAVSAALLGIEVVELDRSVTNRGVDFATVSCPVGKIAIGGGYTITRVDGAPSNELATISDHPTGSGWYVVIRSPTVMTLFEWTLYVVCMTEGS